MKYVCNLDLCSAPVCSQSQTGKTGFQEKGPKDRFTETDTVQYKKKKVFGIIDGDS